MCFARLWKRRVEGRCSRRKEDGVRAHQYWLSILFLKNGFVTDIITVFLPMIIIYKLHKRCVRKRTHYSHVTHTHGKYTSMRPQEAPHIHSHVFGTRAHQVHRQSVNIRGTKVEVKPSWRGYVGYSARSSLDRSLSPSLSFRVVEPRRL